jgi:hypothetical protein
LNVRISISGPPPFTVPVMALLTSRRNRPRPSRRVSSTTAAESGRIAISKSVNTSPISLRSLKFAFVAAGRVTSTLPLNEVNAIGRSGRMRRSVAVTAPLTVFATTEPDTFVARISPFV